MKHTLASLFQSVRNPRTEIEQSVNRQVLGFLIGCTKIAKVCFDQLYRITYTSSYLLDYVKECDLRAFYQSMCH